MNGARRRASLIALRRGSDALVSSTFFSISLCIMLRVSLHALFIREHHSIICFTSKRLVSRGNETFRVCPRVFNTRSRTLHVLHCRLDGPFCFTKHEINFFSATGVLSFFIGNYTRSLWFKAKVWCRTNKLFLPVNWIKMPTQSPVISTIRVNFSAKQKKAGVKWNLEWDNDVYEAHKSHIPIGDAIEVGDVLKPYPRVGVPFLRTVTRTILAYNYIQSSRICLDLHLVQCFSRVTFHLNNLFYFVTKFIINTFMTV